jgi:prevent-host-death family protein
MTELSPNEARANPSRLLDQAAETHKPVRIVGKRNSAMLVSEEDWNAVQETLHLLSIPGMRKSIHEGMLTPRRKLAKKLHW